MAIRYQQIGPAAPLPDGRQVLREIQAEALTGLTLDGQRFMQQYPAQRAGTRYRRTGTLGRSWGQRVIAQGNRVVGEIFSNGNIAPYNQAVQGDPRQWWAPMYGWPGVLDLIKLIKQELPGRVQESINKAFERRGM